MPKTKEDETKEDDPELEDFSGAGPATSHAGNEPAAKADPSLGLSDWPGAGLSRSERD